MVRQDAATFELRLDSFPRLSRLYHRLMSAKKEVCVQRARYITEYMKGEGAWFEPPVIRRAKAVAHVLRNLEVRIRPDELIVGGITSKQVGAIVYPEFISLLIWPELNTLAERQGNSLQIGEAEKNELDKEIFPFWQEKIVTNYAENFTSPPTPISLLGRFGVFLLTEAGGISHTAPDFEKMLKVGVRGLIEEARQKIEILDSSPATDPEALRKRAFYKAMEIALGAVIEFAHRYGQEARRLAESEIDPQRKSELKEIARICEKVPAGPAKSFHEALQSLWFMEIALHQENYEQALCFGRLDQYLYSYYQHDTERGALTEQRALELLGCFFIKTSEFVPLFCDSIALFFAGFPANPSITIGGITGDGLDAANPLSFRILDTRELIKTRHPNIHARIHRNSPPEYVNRVAKVIKGGGGMPAMVNDEIIIPALTAKGIVEEDARDYTVIGCVEISVPRKTFGSTDAALMNLPICLEMALNDGYGTVIQDQVGIRTGDPKRFKGMNGIINAFRKQVAYLVEQMAIGLNALSIAHEQLYPSPLLSAITEGCLNAGSDVTAGGAVYNFTGVQGVGVADVADSLAAIDRLVFRDKKTTLKELVQALKDNFVGHESLHGLIMNLPKYGNDEELPDMYARKVAEIFCREVAKHCNSRGGAYLPGFLTMTTHKGFGNFVGALPSGRRALETFANGLSPCDGWDKQGPTAYLKSVARIDHSLATNGVSVNIKFNPENLTETRGSQILSSLVRTYFDLGGMHLQVNVVDKETLLDAQQHPEKHSGLMVRVAGYSAYFTDLIREIQDEIIARTGH
jgi:formate C-acetyltransferase